MFLVNVDQEKCSGCGECAAACPAQILSMADGKAEVTGDPVECLGCESCTSVCPTGAVTVQEY
ncbi:MAG: 4Fe-4S dicluster domain-containing protein [Thermanaeromonas sp.]|uniref:4Fe-4S binding protein n=1 Tax=Thermanaeromonas sp. TaxID=2003697 RepID=UPI0024400E32|nr:4Fe-4S binding protein [Thermanaeromonas sp.]MCG0277722.1 4Fe-4S dicluster domain-containing protein [Thermanaeromonas sp.]